MDDFNKYNGTLKDQVHDKRNEVEYLPSYAENNESVGCYWQNVFAISAIFRMFFLLFALTGIIASAVSKSQDDNGYFTGYGTLRIAYLVISCVIFAYEATMLTLDIINIFNTPKLKDFPINIIILVVDSILFFGVLICSIFSFTSAKYMPQEIKTTPWGSIVASDYFKMDSFYVMSIVGYLMSMLFVEEIIYLVFQILARFLAEKKFKGKTRDSNYY